MSMPTPRFLAPFNESGGVEKGAKRDGRAGRARFHAAWPTIVSQAAATAAAVVSQLWPFVFRSAAAAAAAAASAALRWPDTGHGREADFTFAYVANLEMRFGATTANTTR